MYYAVNGNESSLLEYSYWNHAFKTCSKSGVFKSTEAALEQVCVGDGAGGIDCACIILS